MSWWKTYSGQCCALSLTYIVTLSLTLNSEPFLHLVPWSLIVFTRLWMLSTLPPIHTLSVYRLVEAFLVSPSRVHSLSVSGDCVTWYQCLGSCILLITYSVLWHICSQLISRFPETHQMSEGSQTHWSLLESMSLLCIPNYYACTPGYRYTEIASSGLISKQY